ncbi:MULTISPECIES: Imm21 family immunity protein [unclassified Bradyrhizobium]|uniref:Imm21 family immunity protein n=1 Tax=unclassified Bradyrhizobium TaxID=2631580 RepID=UPI0028E3321A|nr:MULTISPECIES: Imm21 family immunity protein [unclassified Bradyrhizobium]
MSRTRTWIETTRGPHVLIPAEQLSRWRGIEGWSSHEDPEDQSDYARACRATGWLGSIVCGNGAAVILSGDAGDVAWYADDREDRGVLVQWIGVDDERPIEPALRAPQLRADLDGPDAERLEFETGASGVMYLIDSADRGDDLRSHHLTLALRPGRYLARAAYQHSTGLAIVVREIGWISRLPTAGRQAAAPDS